MADNGAQLEPGHVLLALEGDRPELDDAGFNVLWFDAAARSEIAPSDLLGRPEGRCKWGAAGSAWVQNLLRLRVQSRFSQENIGLRFLASQEAYREEGISGKANRSARDRLISVGLVEVKDGFRAPGSSKGVASLLHLTEAGSAALDKLLHTLAPSSVNQGQSQPAEPGETIVLNSHRLKPVG
jgi:hypothetical protein